ncbi:MAG TPA: hypothetical protein VH599_10240 [Ktedonobacterales bacterium]|jgi:hypothetical protein
MPRSFSRYERLLALVAGLFNLVVGVIFFFHLEAKLCLAQTTLCVWPKATEPTPILSHFIGAIVLGNAVGAFLLAREHDWLRVRPLVVVGIVYGALVPAGLLYDAFQPNFNSFFWAYIIFDLAFEMVFIALFVYHERYQPPTPAASQAVGKPIGQEQ